MPGLNKAVLKDIAVYWSKTGTDEYGDDKWANPKTIKCRWDESESHTFDALGKPIVYSAQVMLEKQLPEGTMLLQGDLQSLDRLYPPPAEARRIQKIEVVPSFDYKETFFFALV